MNRTIARALLLDAFSQVMDNKVFRMLVIACVVMIAPAFLIGFREDGIHLLFGWKSFTWQQLCDSFGMQMPAVKDVHIFMIQGIQEKIVQGLAGTLGILFCIAATAFFVPRMLEKGAADTLFTKPISRFVLLLARYGAGLIFVGVLSFMLVLGIHLGLLIVSGYSDPAFLWCTLTLVYVYALVQTVSVVIGVFTRSSVAAILCTLVFFAFNGCIHGIWVANQYNSATKTADVDPDVSEKVKKLEEESPILSFLQLTLNTLHYSLPKTHDADVLTRKLRTVVVGRTTVLVDEGGKLAVDRSPDGFRLETSPDEANLLQAPAQWASKKSDGTETGRITLSRRSRVSERPAPRGSPDQKPRKTRQSASQAADEFMKTLQGRAGIVEAAADERDRSPGGLSLESVRWSEEGTGGNVARQRVFFTQDDWMYEIDASRRQEIIPVTDPDAPIRHFTDGLRVRGGYMGLTGWYEAQFDWSAPLKFNIFFSVFTSLAFAALMLGIAIWRLSRIDF